MKINDKKNPCHSCGAKCCTKATIGMGDVNPLMMDNLKWLIAHKNVDIGIEGKQYAIVLNEPCQYLDGEVCTIYDKPERFDICRSFSATDCDHHKPNADITILKSPEDITNYFNNRS